jgi:hypothetical protein
MVEQSPGASLVLLTPNDDPISPRTERFEAIVVGGGQAGHSLA